MDYGFVFEGQVFTPDQTAGISAVNNDQRNRLIDRAALESWAAAPDRFIAYYHVPNVRRGTERYRGRTIHNAPISIDLAGARVTTWLGAELGVITRARLYWHNFGGRFIAITVRGNNGACYHGRASWDWGSVIRLRKCKGVQ